MLLDLDCALEVYSVVAEEIGRGAHLRYVMPRLLTPITRLVFAGHTAARSSLYDIR